MAGMLGSLLGAVEMWDVPSRVSAQKRLEVPHLVRL